MFYLVIGFTRPKPGEPIRENIGSWAMKVLNKEDIIGENCQLCEKKSMLCENKYV